MTNRMFSAAALSILLAAGSACAQGFHVAYVEVNDHALANAGCYYLQKARRPFFSVAVIFAANIRGANPNAPEIYLNRQVNQLLNQDLAQVRDLQQKGIRVVATLLGDHQAGGWSSVTDPRAAGAFAERIADFTQRYGLDGIDIDDEYSNYGAYNPASTVMIAQALKSNPKFNGKTLSKALFSDADVFQARYGQARLAQFLNYGAEMTYDNPDGARRLNPYTRFGMEKRALLTGVSANVGGGGAMAQFVKANGFGGVMVYNVGSGNAALLSEIASVETGDTVGVMPNCLR